MPAEYKRRNKKRLSKVKRKLSHSNLAIIQVDNCVATKVVPWDQRFSLSENERRTVKQRGKKKENTSGSW